VDAGAIGSSFLVILIAVFMLWFALGTQRNIRKGNELLRWLQQGLPRLGSKTTLRWLGSSAVQLDILKPREPFHQAQVVVVLEPRDIGILWLWARARSRKDFMILRGELGRPPSYEVEAGDPAGWTGGDRLRNLDAVAWERDAWADRNVGLAHTPGIDLEPIGQAWDRFSELTEGVWRLSVRRKAPHLEVHVRPPDTSRVSAADLIEAFRSLALAVTRR
jgi:hypothetical protein